MKLLDPGGYLPRRLGSAPARLSSGSAILPCLGTDSCGVATEINLLRTASEGSLDALIFFGNNVQAPAAALAAED